MQMDFQEIQVYLQSLQTVFKTKLWIQYILSKQWDYQTLGRDVQRREMSKGKLN
jgi:uncharacterized protein with von Willebrand factor type A (vWA) domain